MSAGAGARIVVVIGVCLTLTPAAAAFAEHHKPGGPDRQQTFNENRALAKGGDASAEYNLGVLYDRGEGVEQNYARARHWYKKAAAQHYSRAEHNLGIMYQSGKGVSRDMAKAAYWFRRGANDGQSASQNNLAVLYMKGAGVAQNTGKAAFWAARAASGGNSAAIANLPVIAADLPHLHVDAGDVDVHNQPDQRARIVTHLASDTVAVVLTHRSDWTQLLLPKSDTVGWVTNAQLSSSQAPLANNAPPETPPLASAKTGAAQTAAGNTPPRRAPASHRQAKPKSVAKPKPESKINSKSIPRLRLATRAKPAGSSAPSATAGASKSGKPPIVVEISRETVPASRPAVPHVSHKTVPAASAVGGDRGQRPQSPARKTAKVGVDLANVRAKPRLGAHIVGRLRRGAEVELLDAHNGWRSIRTGDGGLQGWIAGYLLVTSGK